MSRTFVHIIPYRHLYPPHGGGALRCFNLLRQLARFHKVHAIILQSGGKLSSVESGIPPSVEIHSVADNPPPRTIFNLLPALIAPGIRYRWIKRSLKGPANSVVLDCFHLVRKLIQTGKIDGVLFEHLSSISLAPLVRRWNSKCKLILDSHNVDELLLKQELKARYGKKELNRKDRNCLERTKWMESNLHQFVDSFWACSDHDCNILASQNTIPGITVPNGVDCTYFEFDRNINKSKSSYLIFSGWFGTEANQDALTYLIDDIWPLIIHRNPELKLLVVGGGMPERLLQNLDSIPSIEAVGSVPDVRPYFIKASIAVAPLRIGSGTRLKILEAMSQGNAVVATSKGAEGLQVENDKHIMIADTVEEIANSVLRLCSNSKLFSQIRERAREFVEMNYDWNMIGDKMNQELLDFLRN